MEIMVQDLYHQPCYPGSMYLRLYSSGFVTVFLGEVPREHNTP